MRKIIHRLRARPEHERRHLVHLFTFLAALVVILLWTFSLSKNFNNPDLKTQVKQEFKPFGELKANIIDGYNVISDEQETDNTSEKQ